MNKFLYIAVFFLILTGCSNKQLYQVGQDYQKSECLQKAASGEEHNECLNTDKKSYEEYEKERQDIVNK